jgi:protein gp37
MMDNELHAIEREKIMDKRRAKGLFWDRAWKLVEGCTKVSPGCDSCWSEAETKMRCNHPNSKISDRATDVISYSGHLQGGFAGNIVCREDNLDLPLRTKKPTVWAIWNDLYHEDVTDAFRDRAYAVMASCSQHIFLILTKRSERMAKYTKTLFPMGTGLSFIWHGVTVENQATADERIPYLLQVPGKRFLSIEPMLGQVDLRPFLWTDMNNNIVSQRGRNTFHQVLLGGESGKNARPMNPDWVRSVRDQCEAASVPFFFKQWGEWAPWEASRCGKYELHSHGLQRVGKKKAGRLLDGRTHDDLIWGEGK